MSHQASLKKLSFLIKNSCPPEFPREAFLDEELGLDLPLTMNSEAVACSPYGLFLGKES